MCIRDRYVFANSDRYFWLSEYLRNRPFPERVHAGFGELLPGALRYTQEGTCRSAKGAFATVDYWRTSYDVGEARITPIALSIWLARPRRPV
eukprot:459470-Pyramimonas_sp.AAC.1